MRIIKKRSGLVFGFFLIAILVAILELVIGILPGIFIDNIASRSSNEALQITVVWVTLVLIEIFLSTTLTLEIQQFARNYRTDRIVNFVASAIWKEPYLAADHGELIRTSLVGSEFSSFAVSFACKDLFPTILFCAAAFSYGVFLDWKVGSLIGVMILVSVCLSLKFVPRLTKTSIIGEHSAGLFSAYLADIFTHLSLLRLSSRKVVEISYLKEQASRLLKVETLVLSAQVIPVALAKAAPALTVITVFLLGTILVRSGTMTLGTMISIATVTAVAVSKVHSLLENINQIAINSAALLDFVTTSISGETVRETNTFDVSESIIGNLVIENLSVQIGGRQIIDNLSFHASPGETVLVSGPSGSGKSTLLSIVAGSLRADAGAVTIRGMSRDSMGAKQWARNVALVHQDSPVLARSIRRNLTVSYPEASEIEINLIMNVAALNFLREMPFKLNTRLLPFGANISGGERQRISIARAALSKPTVLLLDEATANLDKATETHILSELRSFLPQAILIIATHRSIENIKIDKIVCVLPQASAEN